MPAAFMSGWLLGLAGLHQLAQLPPQPWPWQMLSGAALLLPALMLPALPLPALPLPALPLPALPLRLPPGARAALLLLLGLLAGLGSGCLRAEQRLQARMGPALEGQEIEVQAEVLGLPQAVQGFAGSPGWRLVLGLAPLQGQVLPPGAPQQVLALGYPAAGQAPWRACERWQLRLRLQRSPGLANPHGFDQSLWMLEQDLQARAQIRPEAQRRLAAAPWHCLAHWRESWRERLQARLGSGGAAGLLVALSVGDQAAIPAPDWQVYRDAGVAHLVAISGLHITMFAWGMSALVAALWRRSEALCLRWPAPRAGAWMGVLAATAYAAFAGWGVPAQRTVWMLLGLACLQQGARRWPWPLSLLGAAWVVCLLDPWAVCQAGFWLSFGAVALLMSQGPMRPRPGWRARLGALLHEQGVVTLGLAPLTLILFQQLSLVGLLANLLAIPLVSFVLTPLALAGGALPLLWEAGAWLAAQWLACMGVMAGWPQAVLSLPVAPPWAQACSVVGAALLVAPLPRSGRLAGLPLLCGLLWPVVPHPPPGRYELLAADVGQGTAVLVRTAHHLLLYDAGPRWGSGADAGQRVLLPLMRALGWLPLDQLVLSHQDLDHVGGAPALLRQLRPSLVRSSLPPGHPLLQGQPHTACESGQRWDWDGVGFEILHPGPPEPPRTLAAARPNHRSCVLRVTDAQGHSALLTGDVEAPDEAQMVARTLASAPMKAPGPPADKPQTQRQVQAQTYQPQSQTLTQPQPQRGQVLLSEVLLLPHHGSRSSSTAALLQAVAPRLALAQAGYRNRFGHPHPDVLARYRAAGIPVWQSAGCGAWRWLSGEAWPHCERDRDPRYWQERELVAQPAAPEEAALEDP